MHEVFFENDDFINEVSEDYEEEIFLDVPTECPKCGEKLEVDTDYDKTMLICSNVDCDYELDATEEFERAAKQFGLDEDDEDAE